MGVVGKVPAIWVPDFETVPGLPHSNNLVRFDVLPDVVRALSPVIDKHGLFNILDIQVFSTDESGISGVHEIGVERIDFDSEGFAWFCANALIDNMDEFVDNPHVLFDVGDIGSLVRDSASDVEGHLQSIIVPIINEVTFLTLVAVVFGGVWSWETSNASDVGLVSDHNLIMTVLGELVRQLWIVFLNIKRKILSLGNWLTSSDLDVIFFVAPNATTNTFTEATLWRIISVVTSSLSVPSMGISVGLGRDR